MELTPSSLPWSAASDAPSVFSSSSSSSSALPFHSCGGFDDLSFSLEDLPPEIRNKIDDIIEKNEDLNSQLEAIDELLFADRSLSKLDFGTKFDIGSESGIGSDSDSGNGILPSSDPRTSSSASSSVLFRPSGQDVDDFISRLIVPPPPPSPSILSSSGRDNDQPVSRSLSSLSSEQSSISNPVASRHSPRPSDEALRLSVPPPLVFGAASGNDSSRAAAAAEQEESIDEQIRVVRAGETFHVTLDVPSHGPWSTPSPTPRQDGSLSVSRILVTADGDDALLQTAKDRQYDFDGDATEINSSKWNNSLPKSVSLSRSSSSSRTELCAWEDIVHDEASISSQSTILSSKSSSSAKSLPSATGTGAGDAWRRPSQLSLESSQKKTRLLRRQEEEEEEEPDSDSVSKYISTPSRYSKGLTGSTVDLRRKKWRPMLESSKGKTETKVGKWSAEGRPAILDLDRADHQEDIEEEEEEEEMKRSASDDDFSSLVQLRGKNGKPAQMVRIDGRTMKAQSMLSLYDPSTDVKDKSKGKKSTKKKEKGSDSKKRLSALFQGKLKFNKKSKDLVTRYSYERSETGATAKADSETELHRSDYLHSTPPPPPVASNRSSIPSPSLYPLMEPSHSGSLRIRSPSRPGNISDIFRIDVRDLEVDDDRPALTFNTFRGQIEPIRWREENRTCSGTSRWTHAPTPEPSLRSSVELPSRKSLPANSSPLALPNGSRSLYSSNSLQLQNDSPLNSAQNSSNRILGKIKSIIDGEQPTSSCIIVVNGMPTTNPPVIKVTAQPAWNPTPSQGPSGEVLRTSDRSAFESSASIVGSSSSSRVFANGLSEDSAARLNGSSDRQIPSAAHDLLGTRISRHQRGNSEMSLTSNVALSAANGTLLPKRATDAAAAADDVSRYDEEQRVLRTRYEDASACDRAVSDTRRMLSSLLADRKWLLSATHSTSGSSFDLYRTRKESLAASCRHLVTDAKLMVAGATRSRQDLIRSLTSALHTFARTFESCRLVVTALPIDGRRKTLLDEVLRVGDIYLSALWSANVAAGRGQNDPAMEQLMQHTTELARSLGSLVSTIKSLDNRT